jgi:hypothetical protein
MVLTIRRREMVGNRMQAPQFAAAGFTGSVNKHGREEG